MKYLLEKMKAIENAFRRSKNDYRKEIEKTKENCDQKIEKIEENCKQKIKDVEENCRNKIADIEKNYEQTKNKQIENKYANTNQNSKQPNSESAQRAEIVHSTEISRPTFFGNNHDVHPKDFLNRLEEYFAMKQTYVGEKIIVVGDCLKSAAFSWFSTIRFQLCNYEEFKKAFVDEYWFRKIQIQVWSQCLNTRYIPSNTSYRELFAMWVTKLRHLEVPQFSEHKIVKHMAKHYPGY